METKKAPAPPHDERACFGGRWPQSVCGCFCPECWMQGHPNGVREAREDEGR
jgi:hypothetical protein